MTDRPDGGHVEWLPWGADAFERAAEREQPLLLSLVATWSEECWEMDGATYDEPRVAAAIDDGFVPVRADVDRHPRVAARYSMGGVPSTVFLTPDGRLLTGAGPLSPAGMRQAIEGVRRSWSEQGSEAGRVPRAVVDQEPPGGDLSEQVERHVLETLRDNFDERAGGWGEGAKFPLPRAIEFALKRDRRMATRTLDAVEAHLLDEEDGGVYRSAASADWSDARTEKLLDANAACVRAFANGYRYTGDETYRDAAGAIVEFLTGTLWTDDVPGSGAFAASQAPTDAGLEASADAATEAATATASAVDGTVVADWNAVAVDALLTYAALTDHEDATEYARRALETLTGTLLADGRVVHYWAAEPAAADATGATDAADEDDRVVERGLLLDHARLIRALVRARSVLGPTTVGDEESLGAVDLAETLADYALSELRPGEAFVDGPRDGPGLLTEPLRPIDGNVELADALLDLAAITGDDRYRRVAREATEAFAGAYDRYGPQTAAFGSVVGRLLRDTVRIDVTAPVGSDLHRAALRLADHEAVVVPAAAELDRVSAFADDSAAAYVTVDGERAEPARTPDELSDRVAALHSLD